MNTQTEKTKPTAKIRYRDMIVAVWENEHGGKSFTMERIYKPKDGQWNSTSSFGIDDFGKIRRILDEIELKLAGIEIEGDLGT